MLQAKKIKARHGKGANVTRIIGIDENTIAIGL